MVCLLGPRLQRGNVGSGSGGGGLCLFLPSSVTRGGEGGVGGGGGGGAGSFCTWFHFQSQVYSLGGPLGFQRLLATHNNSGLRMAPLPVGPTAAVLHHARRQSTRNILHCRLFQCHYSGCRSAEGAVGFLVLLGEHERGGERPVGFWTPPTDKAGQTRK